MTQVFSLNYSLESIVWPRQNKLVKNVLLILAGVLVMAIAAQISIPLHPVPLTLQSAMVLFIALLYGARLGVATLATYLFAGACGLPVFAGMSSGISTLFLGPSSGYFLGFLFAPILSGYLAQRGWGKNFYSSLAAALVGAVIIFYFGLTVLSYYVGWKQAFNFGLKPFLITEPLKLIAVALAVPNFWRPKASE